MRLNWIASLPPAAGDGAKLSSLLLADLARFGDLRLFTPAEAWDPDLERWGPVARLDPERVPWARFQEADATIYVLCDSAASAAIWRVSRCHRGVVVLPSASFTQLVSGLPQGDVETRAAVQRFMLRGRGAVARQDYGVLMAGGAGAAGIGAAYPLADLLSDGALGTVRWGGAAASVRPATGTDLVLHGDDAAEQAQRLVAFAAKAMLRRPARATAELMRRIDRELCDWGGRSHGAAAAGAEAHVESVRGLVSSFGARVLGIPSPEEDRGD